MRIFFSVGEPSGDLHAANLIHQLKTRDPEIECVGYGGPKMRDAGCDLHFELTQLAVMFIWDALRQVRTFWRLASEAESYFRSQRVDAVVLIDYPGFNWWIARRAKRQGIPVFFYGVPQMWAWAPWRISKIRQRVDHVLCKLPFEAAWFEQRQCRATYVGHPYFDQLKKQTYDEKFVDSCQRPGRRLLTLLPGSRDREVEKNLPQLLAAARQIQSQLDNVDVKIACFKREHYEHAVASLTTDEAIAAYHGRTPELMKAADACIACSGSVSLELLHYRKPTVIVYRISRLQMFLQAIILRVKYITLVNLMAIDDIRRTSWRVHDPDAPGSEQTLMPEYLTTTDRSQQIADHLVNWFVDGKLLQAKVDALDDLAKRYAVPGATERAATYILSFLGDSLDYRRLDGDPGFFSDEMLDQAAELHQHDGPPHDRAA